MTAPEAARPEPGGADGSGDVLVLAVGNLLAGDDGVGCHVVEALLAPGSELPAGVRVADGGTLGLTLLPLIADAAAVVLVDAAELGAPPGSVRTLEGDGLAGLMSGSLSVHQIGVADLLAGARLAGVLPPRLALVGVQPASIGTTIDLSPPVACALPTAIDATRAVAARFARELAAG